MSRSNPFGVEHQPTGGPRTSFAVWPLVAIAALTWCSHLAGQNTAPTYRSATAVSDTPASAQNSNPAVASKASGSRATGTLKNSFRPSGFLSKSNASTQAAPRQDNAIVPASHEQPNLAVPDNGLRLPLEPLPANAQPNSLPPFVSRARPATPGPNVLMPLDRGVPPSVTGSHLGLQPGETATERSLRLMGIIADLEQQNAGLAEQNAKLSAEIKSRDAKLEGATLQMNAARKELSLAGDEFKRLQKEIADLREKIRTAEQENTSLMRSLAPLLQQMLRSEDDDALTKE